MTGQKPSILIVGAGPVGLTAAVELTRRGFAPRIVEAAPGPHTESRALGVNPRTLELLEPCGATKLLLERGLRMTRANFHAEGRLLFQIEIDRLEHRYNFMLSLPQADTERVLIETLGAGVIEWNTRTVAVGLDGDRPVVTIERDGTQEQVCPDIMIGADGAHSVVRNQLDFGFAGSRYEHDWGLADFRMQSPYADGELHIFDRSPVLVAIIPMPGGLVRAFSDHAEVLDVLPTDIEAREVIWQTRFRISHRQAGTYRRGNAFLAGDAAHIHSPVGGRGMNLGIEDAAWLAWLIEQGETDRYTALRHPVGARVLKTTDAATHLASADSAGIRFMRRHVLPHLVRFGLVQRLVLPRLAGLSTTAPPWLSKH